jgi:hypothetical protein
MKSAPCRGADFIDDAPARLCGAARTHDGNLESSNALRSDREFSRHWRGWGAATSLSPGVRRQNPGHASEKSGRCDPDNRRSSHSRTRD